MNDVLQRFHRYALSRVVWPLSLIVGLLFAVGWSFAPDGPINRLLGPLTSAAAVGGTFLFIEKLIRTRLWRIAYPEYDFQGTWIGHTEYCHQDGATEKENQDFRPFKKEHLIRFKQDCLSVRVDYDETAAFQGWNSTTATLLNEKGKVGLRYAYEVIYRQGEERDKNLPNTSRGLEEIFVVHGVAGKRPQRVTGSFAHTTDGPSPRYSGTVEFNREADTSETKPHWLESLLVKYWLKPPAE